MFYWQLSLFYSWLICHNLLLLQGLRRNMNFSRALDLAFVRRMLLHIRCCSIMNSIEVQRGLFSLNRLVLCVIIHFVSNLLLDVLKNLTIYKLRERIQLFLVEKCHEVIAEPSHFAFSVKERIFKDPSAGAVNVFLRFVILFYSEFLRGSLSVCPLSDSFFKEHQYKCANTVPRRHGVLWAVGEKHRHLVAFEHDIRKEEFKAILQFEFPAGIARGIVLLLERLLVYAHVWSLDNLDSLA